MVLKQKEKGVGRKVGKMRVGMGILPVNIFGQDDHAQRNGAIAWVGFSRQELLGRSSSSSRLARTGGCSDKQSATSTSHFPRPAGFGDQTGNAL